ncbi:hypothetical protein P43SY_006450 [Pythium insidiosum]|uniref:Kinesin motor domain-containing protein n=1 Tax=Pythium insidiosum TaxID=114742 RepID=A0AAD5LPR4_PYTIN|nr:hypothetical protein P43SY_006450 [Pythium insidiosum]
MDLHDARSNDTSYEDPSEAPTEGLRRARSFEALRDVDNQLHVRREDPVLSSSSSRARNGQRADSDGEGVSNVRGPRDVSSGIADALSLELPRYEDAGGVQNLTTMMMLSRRRGHSFEDDTASTAWSITHEPSFRSRTYTKSLGNLVKHLAPSSMDRDLPSTTSLTLPPPASPGRQSPVAKLAGALPKIWSPRSESGVSVVAMADYPIKYEFALILHNKPTTPRILARNGLDAVGKRQMEVIKRCIAAGLEVSVLSSTLYSRKYMVLLLRPTPGRLQIEKSRLVLERWLQIGAVGEVPSEIEQLIASSHIGTSANTTSSLVGELYDEGKGPNMDDDVKFTPAERLQTIARIITSTANVEQLNPPGAGISLEEQHRNDPIIDSCFPLHNRRVNTLILSKSGQWWWRSNEITNELRFYYGERVAFYFSFVFLYTKCLLVPAFVGSALYFSLRWFGAVEYMRGLCIFGFCCVTVWGTCFLKAWARKNNWLNDAWNLRLFKEAEYPNPTFRPHGYRDVVDSHGVLLFREPYYNPLYRIPAYVQTFVVFLIFIATYIVGITFFVQWYTAAMMAPVCTKCPDCVTFLSCFDTERPVLFSQRWGYILVQGIILGVSLDIFVYLLSVKLIHFFVVRENHATERQFQRTMINRLFVINWISFFLWFILIAFVIVPFGEDVETWLADKFKYKKLTVDWENGVIDMSTALVTPLLITQALNLLIDTAALNLLIDTAVPYMLRKETLKASKIAKKIMRANPAETLLALSEYQSSFETVQTDNSASQTPVSIGFKAKIEGFVVMFSVVWPFCALAALVNNVIHIQNCFNKLFLLRRRPVPRKTNTIGQWEKMLFITLIMGVFMVVGLICVSTGELEYFLTQCISLERFNGKDFRKRQEKRVFEGTRDIMTMPGACFDDEGALQDADASGMLVAVRLRPMTDREKREGHRSCCRVVGDQVVVIEKFGAAHHHLRSQQSSMKEYAYDIAFSPDATQDEVYTKTVKDIVPTILNGYHATIFAYGATGAGKTHTMMGSERDGLGELDEMIDDEDVNVDGIIPHALADIFALIRHRKEEETMLNLSQGTTYEWKVLVSYLEVYNEQIRDLLQPSSRSLALREDPARGIVHVAGLLYEEAKSVGQGKSSS